MNSSSLQPWERTIISPFAVANDNAFSLAYKRGHFDVAKAILEIAQAQYAPEEKPSVRYRIQTDEETEDSGADEGGGVDEPKIYREIVDEKFTVETIGQVSLQVKSRVKPVDILGYEFPVDVPGDCDTAFSVSTGSLLKHVIRNNDHKGLQYYYHLTVAFAGQDKDDDEGERFVAFPQWAFWLAVENGRLEMLADMMKWAGAGLPLEKLVKKTGLELKEVSKYYQGLTVYGKKRKDWATAGRRVTSRGQDSAESPLLYAARNGSMESVEWFLGDAPLRNYLDFGKSKAAKEDARLKHLDQLSGGFEKAVTRWLGSQNDLVISAALLGPNEPKTEHLVEYLIKVCPSSMEAKCSNGMTPLHIACWLGRTNLIKLLITEGADQAAKDNTWDNILHAALENDPGPCLLGAFLEILDPGLLSHLFKERSGLQTSDGRTPLHRWLSRHSGRFEAEPGRSMEVLRLLLKYSRGQGLNTLDGGGETPLHMLVRTSASPAIVRELLALDPQLLYRENAVGRTVADVSHDMFVRSCVSHPPRRRREYGTPYKSMATVLLEKAPEEFAEVARDRGQTEGDTDENRRARARKRHLSNVQQIHDLVVECAGAHPGKRRLVSLHEANDVAKRIGEAHKGQRRGWKVAMEERDGRMRLYGSYRKMLEDGEEDDEDEVQNDVVSTRLWELQYSAWTQLKE